ncbi:S8 family serine peptidase [Blastococcus saxobsidens]|uniref:Subtilase family protease n=1 Tax=Blastococcus saxobsidens (strain DD2) TaxID=1146883 RepID=H6RS92_BLASD|nr:S8 family serine peptidase [Blastococcus saxobsidens]CCG05484.1 Subtilase family protease [Blastococcus saxobsidens DD2]
MTSKRVLGVTLTSAVVAGYAGAAVWSAWAAPPIEQATGFGDGDGLTRYVLTADTTAGDLLAELESVPGVASAQWVDVDRALVAADGLSPERLAAVPGITDVALSTSVPVLGTVTDPLFPQYGWNLENTGSNAYGQAAVADADVDATAGWDTGTGIGRVVAVVDSGFDSDHPELAGALWTNPAERCGSADTDGNGLPGDCHGWNFYANNADIDNGSLGSHGTSVSGVVGARADNGSGSAGVAPGVSIMPLVAGGGSTVDIYLCAKAIRYAVDHGADVVNASWGGRISGPPLDALRSAIAYAEAHGVLVIAAAGNDGGDRDTSIVYPASLPEPNVVTVGSSTAADTIAGHSGYGATTVDLFAPGTRVAAPWNDGGMRLVDGTSFAAPHVAAAVALYRAVLPTASVAELKQALLAGTDRVAAFAGRSVTGGRLSLARIGAHADDTVRHAFTSMTARAGTVTPTVGISTPAGSGRYSVDVGLGMESQGEVWALSQQPVTLDGVTVPTDDAGDARFDLGAITDSDGIALSPAVELAAGRYVLTVQLYRDGEPLGRMRAAPLLVSAPESSGGDAPGGTTPGTQPGTTSPDGATPAPDSQPGTTTPGTTPPGGTTTTPPGGTTTTPPPGTPGTRPPGGTSPAPGTPPGSTPPGATIPAPGIQPGVTSPDGTTPAPGTTSPSPTPGTTPPGGTSPGGPAPGGTAPSPSTPGPTPGTTAPGGTSPGTTPSAPRTTTYPEVGPFGIASLSPNVVDTAGGTLVTITGRALPSLPTVRVGTSATATVVRSSTTSLVVRVPARTAGTYDVTVHARDGRSTVLTAALTYAVAVGSDPSGSTPGGTTPGGTAPAPSSPAPSSPAPSAPGGSTPDGGTAPDVPAAVRTGPHGERLVRSDRFSALGSIWSVNCSASCTGVAI